MRSSLLAIGALILLIAAFFIADFEFFGTVDRNAAGVDAMPAGLRLMYLENLFQARDEGCWMCNLRLAGALQAIENDLVHRDNSYHFDYAKLLPFIPNDRAFHEPIPQLACNSILLSKSDRVYRAMIAAYRRDSDTLVSCARFGLIRVQSVWPRSYGEIKQKISHDLVLEGVAGNTDRWGNSVL